MFQLQSTIDFAGIIPVALFHSLWIASLVAGACWTIERFFVSLRPDSRYWINLGGLFASLLVPLAIAGAAYIDEQPVEKVAAPQFDRLLTESANTIESVSAQPLTKESDAQYGGSATWQTNLILCAY